MNSMHANWWKEKLQRDGKHGALDQGLHGDGREVKEGAIGRGKEGWSLEERVSGSAL